jgi:type II secretory pathway component PulF
MANVNASQEINDATIKLTTTWGELINALRQAADHFEQQEEQSRAAISAITNHG